MDYGLYFHIPFCVRKCIYCDFLSFPKASLPEKCEERYFAALNKEWLIKSEKVTGDIDSVYFGGGTPSVVSPHRIADILGSVRSLRRITSDAEITVEVNPGTVTKEHFTVYKAAGVNRISIGLQSTQERLLRALGRIHTYEDFTETVKLARSAGFDNISCDIIFGIPEINGEPAETYSELCDDIDRLLKFDIHHISAYSIIVEDGTQLKNLYDTNKAHDIDPELERRMYYGMDDMMRSKGIYRYEISNYAHKGHESRHNIRYWECTPYIGLGLGAASYYPDGSMPGSSDQKYIRSSNTRDIEEYISGSYAGEIEYISYEEQMREFMLLGFRKMSGPSAADFKNRFGISYFEQFSDILNDLINRGLIIIDGTNARLTERGCDYANEVFMEFVS